MECILTYNCIGKLSSVQADEKEKQLKNNCMTDILVSRTKERFKSKTIV